jgi:hypothetical protein
MKRALFLFGLILQVEIGFAQSSISIGPDLGLPSNFSSSSKLGIGGSLEYTNRFSEHFGIRFFSGVSSFKGKYFSDDRVSFEPIRLGGQGFLYKDLIFLYAEAGIAGFQAQSSKTHTTGFSYGLGGGYRMPINMNKQFFQLSAYYNYFRYSDFLTYTWLNIRLAYGINFGKKTKVKEE